jgi:predicted aconitase with swiveling domain
MGLTFSGEPLYAGSAEAELMVSTKPISFWGGYDQVTGEIIDRRNDLSGSIASGKILAFPFTVGSSTTTAILLESVRAGVAPAAFVMTKADQFIALACVVAEEMYEIRVPIVVITEEDFDSLQSGRIASIAEDGTVEVS